jgi:putative cardiolipin synthase
VDAAGLRPRGGRAHRRRVRAVAALLAVATVIGCGGLPDDPGRPVTSAFAAPVLDATPLGRAVAAAAAAHPGRAGVLPLGDGHEAFAARVLAARAAVRSLDVQVYLWHGDATGLALFDEALRAADRGVRVRLLIDDNGTAGLDALLASVDAHPNVELRLFNPFPQRGLLRLTGYLTDFARLNRRMHNKSFTADGRLTIVGGRNIGDEYFAAGGGATFADLDLAVVGAIVDEVSASFDAYWNAPPAVPAATVLRGVTPMSAEAFDARLAAARAGPQGVAHARAVAASPLVGRLLDGTLAPEWAPVRLYADDPGKVLAPPDGTTAAATGARLAAALGTPRARLDRVSPYFVPGAAGAASIAAHAQRGVTVRVLTNSLAATDVAAVHAGYAKRREALLRAGVELLELRPHAAPPPADRAAPGRAAGHGSRASLHAKTFAVDGERIFVGSLNLDPRSVRLNTEMGFVVDSPALAGRLHDDWQRLHPGLAWRVELDARGRVRWRDADGTTLDTEPGTGPLRRAAVRVLSWLPIEWLL